MANELSHALSVDEAALVTEDLVNQVIAATLTASGTSVQDSAKTAAASWWLQNKQAIVGSTVKSASNMLRSLEKPPEERVKIYDELMADLDWGQRLQVMDLATHQLKSHNDPKIRAFGFLNSLASVAETILPLLILAA